MLPIKNSITCFKDVFVIQSILEAMREQAHLVNIFCIDVSAVENILQIILWYKFSFAVFLIY